MLETIREALVQAVHADFAAAFPGVPLVHDNAPFNWAEPPDRFVSYEVEFTAGRQIAVAGDPKTRYHGFVYITAYLRDGLGTKWCSQVLKWFDKPNLAYRVLSATGTSINLEALDTTGSSKAKGFRCEHAKVSWRANPA
jgi:hypothetical protein